MKEIDYSDGNLLEKQILDLLNQETELSSDSAPGLGRYSQWALKYHLCPERSNLLRHLAFNGLDVLELGAGMGGVSRYLAETAKSLTAIEGTEARFKALSARLRDLKNWSGIVGNIQDVELAQKFDVVCVIGVLEYSDLFLTSTTGEPAYSVFLKKANSWLKEDGVLCLAIENRLGLKYWSGAAEDHTGQLFDGVCGYPAGKSARTFSRKELIDLINASGLSNVEEYYPFPDYKIPAAVISRRFVQTDPSMAADLAASRSFENYGQPRLRYFPESLALRSVAQAGLLPEFANSFLFLASKNRDSRVLNSLLEPARDAKDEAWYYSNNRKVPTKTVFSVKDRVYVRKEALRNAAPPETSTLIDGQTVHWSALPERAAHEGTQIRPLLAQYAYYGRWEAFHSLLRSFFDWSFSTWKAPRNTLQGQALDATFSNAVRLPNGDFALFDLEWEIEGSFPKSWFLVRNLYPLGDDTNINWANAPFFTLLQCYLQFCEEFEIDADIKESIRLEAEFQAGVTNGTDRYHRSEALLAILKNPLQNTTRYPRSPTLEVEIFEEACRFRTLKKKFPIRCMRWVHRKLKKGSS